MYVVYLSCDFVTKMIIKKINLKIWKSSLISGLWFGIVQFLNRNIQACSWMFPYLVAAKCNYFGGITFYQNFVFKCSMDNCAKIVINISNFFIRQILRIFLIKPAIMISITKFRPFPKPIFIGNFLNFSFGVKLCRNVRVTSYHLIENRQNTLNPRFYGRT